MASKLISNLIIKSDENQREKYTRKINKMQLVEKEEKPAINTIA